MTLFGPEDPSGTSLKTVSLGDSCVSYSKDLNQQK